VTAVEEGVLPLSNHADVLVVEHGNRDVEVLADGDRQPLQRHQERAVAVDADDLLIVVGCKSRAPIAEGSL